METRDESTKKSIPNIDGYLHIYHRLKDIQGKEYLEFPKENLAQIEKMTKKLRIPGDDPNTRKLKRRDLILRAYKPFNIVEIEKYELLDPFRRVQWAMKYIPGGQPTKRRGRPTNWAFNFLFYALVNDMYLLYGKPNYREVGRLLDKFRIEDTLFFFPLLDHDALRKHFDKIDFYGSDGVMFVLEELYDACKETGEFLLPPDVDIPELPLDTLVFIAHFIGLKQNKYIDAEEPLPKKYLSRIQKYKIYQKNRYETHQN